MKRLCLTLDLAEAELLRDMLRAAGIEPSLVGRYRGFITQVPVGIDVADEDVDRAEELLKPYFEKAGEEDIGAQEPEALSPEEAAAFEARVRDRDPLRGWRMLVLCSVPLFIYGLAQGMIKYVWPASSGCGYFRVPIWPRLAEVAACSSAVFVALVLILCAALPGKEKGPASG